MTTEQKREISRRGGQTAHAMGRAHQFTTAKAKEAGAKGGRKVSQNREHMAAIGRKGGQKVAQNREHMAAIGRKGGATVSADKDHMVDIGRKGGQKRQRFGPVAPSRQVSFDEHSSLSDYAADGGVLTSRGVSYLDVVKFLLERGAQ